jgi:hypothetical protein
VGCHFLGSDGGTRRGSFPNFQARRPSNNAERRARSRPPILRSLHRRWRCGDALFDPSLARYGRRFVAHQSLACLTRWNGNDRHRVRHADFRDRTSYLGARFLIQRSHFYAAERKIAHWRKRFIVRKSPTSERDRRASIAPAQK